MVLDGYYYALPLVSAGILIGWLTSPPWGVPVLLLALFFLWFFRDPERTIPEAKGAVVSPADGKVTGLFPAILNGSQRTRISIFLNVFNVHVNRSPIAGTISDVNYQKGKFMNAMNEACADQNENNTVSVQGDGTVVIFKQIAGLLARRIVFHPKIGDRVQRGERIGLIKFGSRVDVLLDSDAKIQIKVGDKVKGGSSVLAYLNEKELTAAREQRKEQGAH